MYTADRICITQVDIISYAWITSDATLIKVSMVDLNDIFEIRVWPSNPSRSVGLPAKYSAIRG